MAPQSNFSRETNKPIAGLFGGNALKETGDEDGARKGKLGGIFDYGDSDEEKPQPMMSSAQKQAPPTGKAPLFRMEEEEDDEPMFGSGFA